MRAVLATGYRNEEGEKRKEAIHDVNFEGRYLKATR
jgi:hypothetical protein